MISTHFRSSHFRTPRVRAPRQGFSLIEVAIALVIFVIGALAIIRIFPGALSVIGNNGNQQIATNLNRTQLADLKSEQVAGSGVAAKVSFNSVADVIFNNTFTDTTTQANVLAIKSWTTDPSVDHSADFRDANSSVIGIPRFNESLPTTQEIEKGTSASAITRYRAVLGEKALVTPLDIGGTPNNYALTQFPVSVQSQGATPALLPVKPVVSQDYTLNDVRTLPNGTLDFSRYRLDDSEDITTATGVTAGSMLYVSYRYYDGSGKIWGIQEEGIPIVTANLRTTTTVKVTPPTGAGRRDAARVTAGVVTDAIVPEIVGVRLRSFVGQGEFGSSTATAVEQIADARRGLVRLPATGVDTNKPVVLDYIADWSFLLQDGVPLLTPSANLDASALMGNQSYRQLALGAPFIEDQAPVSVYSLLIESGKGYSSGYGTVAPEPPAADRMVRATDPQQREDELRSGKVTFIVEDSASRARVAYQTRDNWIQQLSIAASNYKPFVTGNAEPWRNYYLGTDNYLYFHAGEAGKTISLSYSYNDVTDSGTATALPDKVIVDRPYVIDNQLITAPGAVVTAGFASATDQVARVRLQTAQGEDFPATKNATVINLTAIQGVKGASVTARTAYINGTKYAQTLLTTSRGANS